MAVINNVVNNHILVGKKIYYSYTEEIVHDEGNTTYCDYIDRERIGMISAVGIDLNGEFHFLVMADNGKIESFNIKDMKTIKFAEEFVQEEVSRSELLDLE